MSAGESSAAVPAGRPWIASYPPGVPATYGFPQVPVTRLLDDALRDAPGITALIAGDRSMDHATLHARVGEVAGWLHADGVRPGDRIAVAVTGELSRCVLSLAIWRVAAVVVAVPVTRDRHELEDVIQRLDVRGFIGTRRLVRAVEPCDLRVRWTVEDDRWVDRSGGSRRLWSRLRRPWRRAAHADQEHHARPSGGRRELGRPDRRIDGDHDTDEAVGVDDRAEQSPVVPRTVTIGPSASAEALIVPDPSGGAIAWTHANLVAGAFQARLWVPDIQATQERFLVDGALDAIQPIVLGWLLGLLSASPVILSGSADTADLAAMVVERQPTVLIASSGQVQELIIDRGSVAGRDLSCLRVALGHGGALPTDVVVAGERRMGGSRIRAAAALTPLAAMTHAQPVYGLLTPESLGFPVTATDAVVVAIDDPGRVLGVDEPGRLLVQGPQLGARLPAATPAGAGHDDGWVGTDHVVNLSAGGVFTHLGVIGHLPHRDGLPVATTPIEVAIAALPGVVQVAVIPGGVPSEVVAVVAGARRSRPTVEAITAHCAQRLSGSVTPDRIVFVDQLPLDAAGRIDRTALRGAEEVTRG